MDVAQSHRIAITQRIQLKSLYRPRSQRCMLGAAHRSRLPGVLFVRHTPERNPSQEATKMNGLNWTDAQRKSIEADKDAEI